MMTRARRWIAIGLLGLAVAACLSGLTRLRFEVDPTRLLPDGMPEARGARAMARHFLRKDELLVVIAGDSAEAVELSSGRVAEKLRGLPEVRRVSGAGGVDWEEVAELVAWALLNLDQRIRTDLLSGWDADELHARLEILLDRWPRT
jgi:hypothetical protein